MEEDTKLITGILLAILMVVAGIITGVGLYFHHEREMSQMGYIYIPEARGRWEKNPAEQK